MIVCWLYVPYEGFANFPEVLLLAPRNSPKNFRSVKQNLCYNEEPLLEQTQPLALFFEEEKNIFPLPPMILLDSFTGKHSFYNLT